MKPVIILSFFFGIYSFSSVAQVNDFETYAATQNALFVKAYEERNIPAYLSLMNDFMLKFDRLTSAQKKQYAGYLQNVYYNLCCTYSLLNNKSMALVYLQKSIEAGYYNYSHIQRDRDLNNLRQEGRFLELIEKIRSVGDYVYILQRGARYNLTDSRDVPLFTYQSSDAPDLVALRKGFKLDSIAGEGNDVSKMINLMHWVHNLIPHDGNHPNPQVKNAMSMIKECKLNDRGLNCRGLATVLNECYLAIGLKSRFVTCLPKDSLKTDPDCHVINIVYSESLNKWVWMDPTNDAYVMNEKGELLSIEEVRQRIISGETLILNPNANWNNKVSIIREDYLYNYMAKNLYMLQCTSSSEYDSETHAPGKVLTYITLVPEDYFSKKSSCATETNEKNKVVYRFCETGNPAVFWQLPKTNF